MIGKNGLLKKLGLEGKAKIETVKRVFGLNQSYDQAFRRRKNIQKHMRIIDALERLPRTIARQREIDAHYVRAEKLTKRYGF